MISLTTEFVAVSSIWIAIDMYLAQSVVVFLGKDRNVYNCCRFVGLSLPLILFDTSLLLMNLEIIVDYLLSTDIVMILLYCNELCGILCYLAGFFCGMESL